MSIADDIKSGLSFFEQLVTSHGELVGMLISGLSVIAEMTTTTTDDKAVEVLSGVRAVLESLAKGVSGTVTPDITKAELAKLAAAIAGADARADADLAARFPHG